MNVVEFWDMIDDAKLAAQDVTERQVAILTNNVGKLTPDEMLEFDHIFNIQMALSYQNKLWDALGITGEYNADDFDEFRAWLIAQGETTFGQILAEPDALADLLEKKPARYYQLPRMLDVARPVYQLNTGKDLPPSKAYQRIPWLPESNTPIQGTALASEDLAQAFPRLWAKFH